LLQPVLCGPGTVPFVCGMIRGRAWAWLAFAAQMDLRHAHAEEGGVDCESHPGGCRCYYDALADGCPQSIGQDGQVAMCSCEYNDNTWLHVLTHFLSAFRASEQERATMASQLSVRLESGGLLSMEVGYSQDGRPKRVGCGEPLANVHPGTNFEADPEEVDKFARNLFWPQVREKLNELCLPGRVALGLLCLHAEIGRRNARAVRGYAAQLVKMAPKVVGCADRSTPWPFPGLTSYLQVLKNLDLPDGSLDYVRGKEISWWPDPGKMRGKRPDESDSHYWPCVPLQDRECFPTGIPFLQQSCEHCCDPGQGPRGDESCFDSVFTFKRCCRTPNDQGFFY